MSEERKETGCLTMVLPFIAAWLVLWGIEAIAGRAASMWFGGGFLVAALLCFWEAGRKIDRERGNP